MLSFVSVFWNCIIYIPISYLNNTQPKLKFDFLLGLPFSYINWKKIIFNTYACWKSTYQPLDCPRTFAMDIVSVFRQLVSLFITYTYLAIVPLILLLTGTIGIVNNGNILTDGRDKRKYLERKYMNNEL